MRTITTIFFSILVLGAMLLSSPVHAQVTIGSSTEPNAGALLDLKENNNATNTTKGLGMPRVKLTSLTSLIDIDPSNATRPDPQAHIGLMVYHPDQCTMLGKGLYVWNGTQWQFLQSDASGVIRHAAKTGVYEAFTSASFGTAGRWMTTNLAAKAYDSNILPTTATLPILPSATMSEDIEFEPKEPEWCYPSATDPLSAIAYTANNKIGLLYNYPAATAKSQNANSDDESNLSYANRQGICPNGWHLPSNNEWKILQQEFTILKNSYSTLLNDASSSTNEKAMLSECLLDGQSIKGFSKSLSNGGFSALLAGAASFDTSYGFGELVFFWTSSSASGLDSAFHHKVELSDSQRPSGSRASRANLFSVRCKQD